MMPLRDYTPDRKATEGVRELRKSYILETLEKNEDTLGKNTLEHITNFRGKTMKILLAEMIKESKIEIEGKTITRL